MAMVTLEKNFVKRPITPYFYLRMLSDGGGLRDFVFEMDGSGQLERETRLELATTCLEGRDSTN